MSRKSSRIQISTLDEPGVTLEEMIRDVRAGLSLDPKDLSASPKYLYDAEGSRIFEEITDTPEYYQTDAEFSILRERSDEIVSRTGCRTLIELGSGSSSKTRALLDALVDSGGPARYAPLDVSQSAIEDSGEHLASRYPDLNIRGYIGDFDKSLRSLLESAERGEEGVGNRLIVLLGGTIGNFSPESRQTFLGTLRQSMGQGDHLLIGVDLVKRRETLEAAYDDSAGVTARFNKNLLKVLNSSLDADFDQDLFAHRATYDETHQRVEMWLDALADQEINLPAAEMKVRFEKDEGMRTELSSKFTRESAARMFEDTDLHMLDLYTDPDEMFGLTLAAPRS